MVGRAFLSCQPTGLADGLARKEAALRAQVHAIRPIDSMAGADLGSPVCARGGPGTIRRLKLRVYS